MSRERGGVTSRPSPITTVAPPRHDTRARSTALPWRLGDTMSEFNIHAESIDVEQLMEQIRARIREKRGVDYTEQQIRELAGVKLERFLDPRNVRSDLLDHYRQRAEEPPDPLRVDPPPPSVNFEFDGDTIYRSSRGVVGRIIYGIRRLLRPVLKLFFNPNPIVHALHTQQRINHEIGRQVSAHFDWTMKLSEQMSTRLKARAELDALTYELLNNLVVEMTRLSIDVKNHKMQVESIAGRLDFDERRARALEGVVEYRTRVAPAGDGDGSGAGDGPVDDEAAGPEKRKRRRRRGRRRSGTRPAEAAGPEAGGTGEGVATDPAEAGDAGRPSEDVPGPEPAPAEASAPEHRAEPAAGGVEAEPPPETRSEPSGTRNGAPDPDEPATR